MGEKKRLSFRYTYTDDSGTAHKNYESYAKAQGKIIAEWSRKRDFSEEQKKEIAGERDLTASVRGDKDSNNFSTVAVNKLLRLGREQELRRPRLFEKIKTRARELLDRAAEFSGYRNFKNTIDEIREARAETARQKERERRQAQQLPGSQQKPHGRGR
jgi:hypothetical protein